MSLRAGVGLVLVMTACQASVSPGVEAGALKAERRGGRVDVGGRALFLDCGGAGTPTVILEAGGGGDGTAWENILPELRRTTTACVYDRAGLGLSDEAPRPHTLQQMVDDLDALLTKAEVRGPHVLVGHSLGGLIVRSYASQHPAAVRGMVLLDPTTEEQDTRVWSLLPPQLMREFEQNMSASPEGLDYASLLAGMAELRRANRGLGDSPLVVLTAVGEQPGAPPGLSAETAGHIAREWLAMHEEIARLSSNGVHVRVATGHDITSEAPAVVVAAIREVLASARTNQPLSAEHVSSAAGALAR